MSRDPFISVIVPVHNAAKYLDACLAALLASVYPAYEVIVVDDASTDGSVQLNHQQQATLLRLNRRSGPAAARNAGAREAHGELLFFVDADVLVRPETLNLVASRFSEHPEVTAVFGSYDDQPAAQNFISQYKNLYHHFTHQRARTEALTFWAGCGAIRRKAFEAVQGFDEQRFPESSIEDIELGHRVISKGYRILLDKSLQVKHLKRWTFKSLLHSDIFYRALPWSKLILETGQITNDLNLRWSDRVSTALVGVLLVILPFDPLFPLLLPINAILLAAILALNYKLYLFFLRHRGFAFAAMAFPLQVLYYFYSGFTFAFCCGTYLMNRTPEPAKCAPNEN